MLTLKRVSVVGLGKLGACMAANFAHRGLDVLGIENNPETVRKINAGEAPVTEPLLSETIAGAKGRLRATTNAKEAVDTDACFVIVPSPSLPDGSFSNEFLMRALQPIAQAVKTARKKDHLFVVSSTTTPGACRRVIIQCSNNKLAGLAESASDFVTTRS